MQKELEIAILAARKAGELQRNSLGKFKSLDYKSAFNLVTDVDKASEELIIRTILETFPEHEFLAEEGGLASLNLAGSDSGEKGRHSGATGKRWIIDPLDGTTNFAHSYPFFCVSIAYEVAGEVILGVVYNPISNELFSAQKGKGAFCNSDALKVSTVATIGQSLLVTGFPPDTRNSDCDNMATFKHLTNLSHGVRRDGAAALDLCFVAAGRLDGFWEYKLNPWDIAAGALIVQEAGGRVSNPENGPLNMEEGHILASNGLIHQALVGSLQEARALPVKV